MKPKYNACRSSIPPISRTQNHSMPPMPECDKETTLIMLKYDESVRFISIFAAFSIDLQGQGKTQDG